MDELVVRQKPARLVKLLVYAVILIAASVYGLLRPGKIAEMIRMTSMAGGTSLRFAWYCC